MNLLKRIEVVLLIFVATVYLEQLNVFNKETSLLSCKSLWARHWPLPVAGYTGLPLNWVAADDKLDRGMGSAAVRLHTPW